MGAFDTTYNGGGTLDVFVTKLNPTGSGLVYSTYLGGSNHEYANGIAIDSSGNAYITGVTYSTDFPTTAGAFDTTFNGGQYDAFVTKLNATGSGLVYSTYLGGSFDDVGYGIAIDSSGNAYLTGFTTFTDFPTTAGAFDITYNGGQYDAFVTKLNATGSGLVYSTYLGGSESHDIGFGIAIDSSGNAYVTGYTISGDFPTTAGAFDTTYNGGFGSDVFITKLNATGSGLVYSTYLGGSAQGQDIGRGITLDGSGNAYVTGYTLSTDFPTTSGAFDTTYNGGAHDVFITKLNATGSGLVYSTYLGGSFDDRGNGIAIDGSGNVYVTGYTSSTDFPTTSGAFDTTHNNSTDVFVVKLNFNNPNIISISPSTPVRSYVNQSIVINGGGFQQNLTVTITFPSGASTTLSGTQIQNVTSTSFTMLATLNATGPWSIKVNNPDGGQSNTFNFAVGSGPLISSINPASPVASSSNQNISVLGNGLR